MLAIVAASILLDGDQLKPISYPDLQKAIFESYRALDTYSFRYVLIHKMEEDEENMSTTSFRGKGERQFTGVEVRGEAESDLSSVGPDQLWVDHRAKKVYATRVPEYLPRKDHEFSAVKVDSISIAIDQYGPRVRFRAELKWVSAKRVTVDESKQIEIEYSFKSLVTGSKERFRIWFTEGDWLVTRFLLEGTGFKRPHFRVSQSIDCKALLFEPNAVLAERDLEIKKSVYEGYEFVRTPPLPVLAGGAVSPSFFKFGA